jgi:subtilisin family serine protease
LLGVYNSKDDWTLGFRGDNEIFTGTDGKQMPVFVYKTVTGFKVEPNGTPKFPEKLKAFMASVEVKLGDGVTVKTDALNFQTPAGNYVFWSYGTSANVVDGKFDLYITSGGNASFGTGASKTGVVGSPGNANNAITVGAYDFRSTWDNIAGQTTFYNMQIGGISDFSSMGFRRDGVVKPEIAAPSKWTISPLSQFAKKVNGGCESSMANDKEVNYTADGFHVAWSGTSASSPFTAGVIALMLQKNPNLDAAQIKQILQKTARTGGLIGSVPNAAWGYGMLDSAAALAATPAAVKTTTTTRGGKK